MSFLGGLGGSLRTVKGKSKATADRIAADLVKELHRMRERGVRNQYAWLCLNYNDSYTLTFGEPEMISDVDCDGITAGEEMSAYNDEVDMEYIAASLLKSAVDVREELGG